MIFRNENDMIIFLAKLFTSRGAAKEEEGNEMYLINLHIQPQRHMRI